MCFGWHLRNTEGASILAGIINITGISSDNKQISITLKGTSTGQYILNQNSLSVLSYIDAGSSNNNAFTTNQGTDTSLAGGTVTVTVIDTVHKTISGYFTCKVYREMDSQQEIITQGSFTSISYVTTLPPAPLGDTFHVKVEGVEWIPPSMSAYLSSGNLVIGASASDASRTVGLVMPQNTIAGTYTLNFFVGIYFGEYSPDPATFLVSDPSGTITILENNTTTRRIRGNFQFPAVDLVSSASSPVALTEGYFSLLY